MLVLGSSERVFERGLDHPLESPVLVLRVILIIEMTVRPRARGCQCFVAGAVRVEGVA